MSREAFTPGSSGRSEVVTQIDGSPNPAEKSVVESEEEFSKQAVGYAKFLTTPMERNGNAVVLSNLNLGEVAMRYRSDERFHDAVDMQVTLMLAGDTEIYAEMLTTNIGDGVRLPSFSLPPLQIERIYQTNPHFRSVVDRRAATSHRYF